MISVDSVLSEKLPNLSTRHPIIRRTLATLLKYFLHEREFKLFEEKYPSLEGFDFVEQVLEYFDFGYRVLDRELGYLPQEGRLVIVANHPIGSLDGLALLKLVGELRKDVKVIANEILYAIKPLRSLLLPVDNLSNKTARDNILAIREHLDNEGAIIVFPAGEVSRFGPGGIRDGRWDKGFLRFAKAAEAPVLPMHVNGRNSLFFYVLSILSKPLSGLWLVREMFKQANQHVDVRIGHPVYPDQYNGLGLNNEAKAKFFKKSVYKLGKGKYHLGFEPDVSPVAKAEDRQALKKEIARCEVLGQTEDGKKIFLYRYETNSSIMREIGRLRELTFRTVGEGTGKRRDVDIYDHFYDHIVLWDDHDLEIVGAYRVVQTARVAEASRGILKASQPQLYTQTLFDFTTYMESHLDTGLELGRSFVQPKYWGKRSLDYLWFGIGSYLRRYPEIQTLFGSVSISATYSQSAKDALVYFYSCFFKSEQPLVKASNAYEIKMGSIGSFHEELSKAADYPARLTALKGHLRAMGESIPTLYKQYVEVTEEGGTEFCCFNVDADFADCIDGFVLVRVNKIKPSRRKRYIGKL